MEVDKHVCALHIYNVTNAPDPLVELKAWFIAQLDELWPVALGSPEAYP